MREELQDSMKRLVNFVNFARSFFKRKNPFKELAVSILSALKDMLTIRQKLKMANYRENYHKQVWNKPIFFNWHDPKILKYRSKKKCS